MLYDHDASAFWRGHRLGGWDNDSLAELRVGGSSKGTAGQGLPAQVIWKSMEAKKGIQFP